MMYNVIMSHVMMSWWHGEGHPWAAGPGFTDLARHVVLHQHVRLVGEAVQEVPPAGGLQVHAHALLVPGHSGGKSVKLPNCANGSSKNNPMCFMKIVF